MRKLHKCLNLSAQTIHDLHELQTILGCESSSEVVAKLVDEELARQKGTTPIEINLNTSEQIITLLKTIIKICRTTEEQSYVTYDALNNYLLYLAEDGSLSDYRSCDTELSLSNRQNRSDYYEKAHANYTIKIKNGQQHKTTL